MSFVEEFIAGVEMACPLDANHRVKMVVRKIQFGRVHYLEGAAGCQRARIRNLRVGNVNAGNHLGRISLHQPLGRTPESASHIQNPACSVGDSRDHLIDERIARLPLRLRPCAPVTEIEIAAVLVVATLIAAAHHAVIGAGTHRPTHRHHAHACRGGPSHWAPSLAQRSIRRKCRSDCIRSPANQGPIAGYRIGTDQSAYVRPHGARELRVRGTRWAGGRQASTRRSIRCTISTRITPTATMVSTPTNTLSVWKRAPAWLIMAPMPAAEP